jgi:glycosyltransferase involved in cell wall biosynthesis
MRPRIAIVAPSTDILGGQSVQADTLCSALRGDGWDVTFIPINPAFPPALRDLRQIRYVRTVLNEFLYVSGLRQLRDVDVVHVFTASYWSFLLVCAPALTAARVLGKRVILNYHSGEADDHLNRHALLLHPFLRMPDQIVVPSTYLQGVFARHGYPSTVVPNAIDLARFHYRERAALRPLLLSNRNLEPHYRVEDAVLAHRRVQQHHPDARLVVAGTGSTEHAVRKLAAPAADSVRFLGRIAPDDMPRLYAENDIFVNASIIDNQPLSVLEAFAAGVPVVSTPTGDLEHLVRDGETGLVVPPRDPDALAAAVESLLADPGRARQMARRAHAEVARHSWSAVKQGWEEVYAS